MNNHSAGRKRGSADVPVLLFAMFLFACLSLSSYLGAGRDDVFITLRAGQQMAAGQGLVNYNSEPLEMSSSLLHVILIAVLDKIIPEAVYSANKLLGFLCGFALFAIVFRRRDAFFRDSPYPLISLALALTALATYPAWCYWNLGGLETPFQTLLLFAFCAHLDDRDDYRRPLPAAIYGLMYLLVRPEGFIIILMIPVLLIAHSMSSPRPARSRFISLFFLLFACQLILMLFRYHAFGMFFPNPVYAKTNPSFQMMSRDLKMGFDYLKSFYTSSPFMLAQFLFLLAALLQICFFFRKKSGALAVGNNSIRAWVIVILFNHAFILGSGGDWMEYYRFAVPAVPFLCLLSAVYPLKWIRKLPPIFKLRHLSILLLLILVVTNLFQRGRVDVFDNCSLERVQDWHWPDRWNPRDLDQTIISLNCAYQRDREAILPFIEEGLPYWYETLGNDLRIVTYQMGFFPYYIKKLYPDLNIRFIDTKGITDRVIPHLKGSTGLDSTATGGAIHKIISHQAGVVSEYVLAESPNMIYMLNADQDRRRILEESGWRLVWNREGAVVFIHAAQQVQP